MRLRDLFDEATTGGDEPPSRVTADDVYTAGMRRRRVSRALRVGTPTVAGFAVLAVLVTVMAPARAPDAAAGDDSTWVVHAAGGYDRNHLWLFGEPRSGGGYQLRASDDGGRTWVRRRDATAPDLQVLGSRSTRPGAAAHSGYGATGPTTVFTSDDWRTVREASRSDTPVDRVPRDAPLFCEQAGRNVDDSGGSDCRLAALDLDTGVLAPLATQPDIAVLGVERTPAGTIWVAGYRRDPGPAGSGRPAVASSPDGRSWSTLVLDALPSGVGWSRLDTHLTVGGDSVVATFQLPATLPPSSGRASAPEQYHVRVHDGAAQVLDDRAGGPFPVLVSPDGTVVGQVTTIDEAGRSASSWSASGPPWSASAPAWSASAPPWSASAPAWSASGGPSGGTSSATPFPSAGASPPGPRFDVRYFACPPGATRYERVGLATGLPADDPARFQTLAGGGYLASTYGGIWFSDDGLAWRRVPRPR